MKDERLKFHMLTHFIYFTTFYQQSQQLNSSVSLIFTMWYICICIFVFLKSLYRMVVSVYIFTEYIKITAFQTSPVERQVETIASFRQKLE